MENTKSSWRRSRLYWQTQKKKNCTDLISQRPLKNEKKEEKKKCRNSKLNCSQKLLMAEIRRLLQRGGHNWIKIELWECFSSMAVSVMRYEWCNMWWNPVFYAFCIQPFLPHKGRQERDVQNFSTKHPPIHSNHSPRVCLPKRRRSVRRQQADAAEPINLFFFLPRSEAHVSSEWRGEKKMEGSDKIRKNDVFSAVFGNVPWNTSANNAPKKSSPDRNSSGVQINKRRERERYWGRGENKNKWKCEVWHLFIADLRRHIRLLSLTLWRRIDTSFIRHNTKISVQCQRL